MILAATAPVCTNFVSRVSTKMPCWGRAALGYNVVNVRMRTAPPENADEAVLARCHCT